MKKSYDRIRKEIAENKKEVIQFALPLMWSHAEYARALIDRREALVVDKEGLIERQFINDQLKNASHLIINDSQTMAWFESDKRIYEMSLGVE